LGVPSSWNSRSPSEPLSNRTLKIFFMEAFLLLRPGLGLAVATAMTAVTPRYSSGGVGFLLSSTKLALISPVSAANFLIWSLFRGRVVLIGSEGVDSANFVRLDLFSTNFLIHRGSPVPLNPISYSESELSLLS